MKNFVYLLLASQVLFLGSVCPSQARMVHDFDCTFCHLSYSSEEVPYMTYNVCLDCHYPGNEGATYPLTDGSASNPITATFAAGDGSNAMGSNPAPGAETSHFFAGGSDEVAAAGAVPPTDWRFNLGWATGQVTCSRCHNPHGDTSNPKLLKLGAGSADAMCLECHAPWDQTGNHGLGSHPLHADYPALAAANADKFRPVPDNFGTSGSISLVDEAKVSCTSCHGVHWVDSDASTSDSKLQANANQLSAGDGKLLKFDDKDHENPDQSICQTCHSYAQHGGNSGLGCLACHVAHEYGADPNYYLLRKQVEELTLVPKTGEAGTVALDYGVYPPPANLGGICQQCHTLPASHDADDSCKDCHFHKVGFAHGTGSNGVGCVECHGHDAGTLYDADMQTPYTAGAIASQGVGTAQSHSTHTELSGADAKGPSIYCDGCHDIDNFPYFKSGTDGDGDGRYNLAETDVCDTCHSPAGSYDGISDPAVGAKQIWTIGAYDGTESGMLLAGKDKWCVTCHDEAPSVINSVNAPNVAGDENGDYTYGTGWGFYKTGHGLPVGETYPSKGGIETVSGRPIECDGCHDYSTAHIDGLARTFDCGPSGDRLNCDSTEYRSSYRLKLVDGDEPMFIPWRANNSNKGPSNYRLCASCHVPEPFSDSNNTHTNFYTWDNYDIDPDPDVTVTDMRWQNRHTYHVGLGGTNSTWPADYAFSEGGNSRSTCVTCHNVHGSTQLAMIRDGKLIDREPGLLIRYADEATTAVPAGSWYFWPPDPENVTLAESAGTFWQGSSSTNLCGHCHNWPGQFENRCEPVDIVGDDPDLGAEPDCSDYVSPFPNTVYEPPTLEWTGENGYTSDGVEPNNGSAYSRFTFRVKFTDIYNSAPWKIQLWIDKNDDGIYEDIDGDPSDEKIDLAALDPYDDNYSDGMLFTVDVTLDTMGDNSLTYRFYTLGAWEDTVTLPAAPDPDPTVAISNNLPLLTWTGETDFETDGVFPNTGGLGGDYLFRIDYTDDDNECPTEIQVWMDEDDDGYEAGEKFDLTEVSATDSNCSDGKLYTTTRTLSTAGSHNYRFYASDGIDAAIGEAAPVSDNTVTVQSTVNSPPQLDWVTESCLSDGVKPALGLATGDFEFKVRYTDPDGNAPTSCKVWLDLNDNGTVEAGEEQDLAWVDDGDENYADGEVFAYTWTIGEADAGVHEFIFSANDSAEDAIGAPTEIDSGRTVNVVSTAAAKGVRQGLPGYSDPWYETIQAAIDPIGSIDPDARTTILVYEGIYHENVALDRALSLPDIVRDNNITLQSVCGPEQTVIQGRDDDGNGEPDGIAVHFDEVTNPVIDGFTITDGTEGVVLFHSSATVKNCTIEGNGRGIRSSNDIGLLTLEDSTIQNNVAAGEGAGIYLYGGSAQHTISRSVIKNNQTTGAGGGICLINSGSGKGIAIEETTISGNTSSGSGGGIYMTRSLLDLEKVVLSSNTAGSGGGLFIKENSTVNMTNGNVVDNTATNASAGIGFWCPNDPGFLNMTNCTVSNNSILDPDTGSGGGLNTSGGHAATVSISNSIFWGNEAGSGHEVSNNSPGTISFAWSDVLNDSHALSGGGTTTTDATCLATDPFFVDSNNGDYHLMSISPTIDQGTATGAPVDDLDGNTRDGSPDIGAYEASP